jgi:L-lactate dehydrogenase
VAWSAADVGGTPLLSLDAVKALDREKLATQVRTKAYSIIAAKGSTYYGIGGCVAQIVKSILHDTRQVRPVSHYIEHLGVCLSLPAVVGREGVISTMVPPLTAEEVKALEKSALAIKQITDQYA